MRKMSARFATTHADRHGDRMLLSALESWVESVSHQYLPVIYNHDPRTPPIGRIVSANIVPLSDGEYAVEADIELFEPGDQLGDWRGPRSIPIRTYASGKLELAFDRNYEDQEDQVHIQTICDVLQTHARYEVKKALDPISILTIGGLFLIHNLSSEFLKRLSADGYEIFKQSLKKFIARRKAGEKDKLLRFDLAVQSGDYIVNVEVIMTNPDAKGVDLFLDQGLKKLEVVLPTYYRPELGVKRIIFECNDGELKYRFAIRQDSAPIFPREPSGE